ncbi:tetratricopeptide (TPR) repeat protein [Actinoplanes campanulatus]|uniref:Tetratricopeptide (TPR) repeat protein n=1 Tax=Actinoplanes campanulatus TaxID=113559 RepID=A0A7W5FEQ5_9ACTN|nr:tetratricopeptide repeat protein [Actinoplanes campanulatus]MBB3095709.1 tetratricopeptide (TPR) repeat protein [Actinoplanes campanulatus]
MTGAHADPAVQIRQALHLAQVGRASAAVPVLRRLLAEDPGNVAALRALAHCLQQAGRYDEMLSVAEQAAALVPADPAAHRQRAIALLQLRRTRAALDAATEARRLGPHDFINDVTLAHALLAAGGTARIVAAGAAADRARRLAPQESSVHLATGDALRRMADFRGARQAYRTALALDPESALALQRLGAVDADRGRALRSSALLSDTLRVTPHDPDVLHTATSGARRALWLLTDAATVPLVAAVVTAVVCRAQVAGTAGALLAAVPLLLGVAAAAAFLRWRWRRLAPAARTLIRRNLWRVTFAFAVLRLAAIALSGLLTVADPAPGSGSGLRAVATPLTTVPLLLLMLRLRNRFASEFYFLLRRCWFRLRVRWAGR